MNGCSWTLWMFFFYIFSLLPYHTRASFRSPIRTWPLTQASRVYSTGCYESITASHHPILTYRPMHFDSCFDTKELTITYLPDSFTLTLEVYPETESGVIMHYRVMDVPELIVQLFKGTLYVVVKQVILVGRDIFANTWTSLAISFDSPSGTFYLHVNGYQVDSSAGHQFWFALGNLRLGNGVNEAEIGDFKGMMTCLSLYDVSVQSFDTYNMMYEEAMIKCSQDTFITQMYGKSDHSEITTDRQALIVWPGTSYNTIDSIKTSDWTSTSDNIWVTTSGQARQQRQPSSLSNTMAYILIGVLTAAVVGLGLVIGHLVLVCRRKKKTERDKAVTSPKRELQRDTAEEERMENIYVVS